MAEGAKTLSEDLSNAVKLTIIADIPTFVNHQKFLINEDIKSGMKTRNILAKYGIPTKVTDRTFAEIPKILLDSRFSISISVLIFMYQCFSWAYDDNHKRTKEEFKNFISFCQEINEKARLVAPQIEFALSKAFKSALKDSDNIFIDDICIQCIDLFNTTKFLKEKFGSSFSAFAEIAFKKEGVVSNHLYECLISIAAEQKKFYTNANFNVFSKYISFSVNNLDPRGLLILGYSSMFAPHDLISYIFQFIPGVMYSRILQSNKETKINYTEFKKMNIDSVPINIFTEEFFNTGIYDYKPTQKFSFEGTEIEEICSNITNTLAISSPIFRDLFFVSCLKVLNSDKLIGKDAFSCTIVSILHGLSHVYPLTNAYSVIAQSTVIRSHQNIFEDISPDIDCARNIIFSLVTKNSHELIVDLFNRFSESPLLLAEYITRIRNNFTQIVDFSYIITEQNMRMMIEAVLQLANFPTARNIVFDFIMFLASSAKTSNECFKLPSFSKFILYFIFDTCLSESIIIIIRNALSCFQSPNEMNNIILTVHTALDICLKNNSEDYNRIAEKLFACIEEILEHNPCMLRDLVYNTDKCLSFSIANKRTDIVLNYIKAITQANPDFCLTGPEFTSLIKLFNEAEGVECREETFNKLLDIIYGYMYDPQNPQSIKCNFGVSLAFGILGQSSKLQMIIESLLKLVKNSWTQAIVLHKIGVDNFIIQYLSQNEEKSVTVNHDRHVFRLTMNKETLNVAIELLQRIAPIISDQNILVLFTKSFVSKNANLTASLLERTMAICSSQPTPAFAIGMFPSQISAQLDSSLFNSDFTISFSLKSDAIKMSTTGEYMDIFSITDEARKKLTAFICRGTIYVTYNNVLETSIVTIMKIQQSNSWINLALCFHHENEDKLKITRFCSSLMCSSNEIDIDEFTGERVLFEIGGAPVVKSKEVFGQVTNFQIFPSHIQAIDDITKLKPEFETSQLFQQEEESQNNLCFINKKCLPDNILDVAAKFSFHDIICSIFKCNEDLPVQQLFSIMKILAPTIKVINSASIESYVLSHKELISYNLYRTFLQIMLSMKQESTTCFLIDIVGNLNIWVHAQKNDLKAIIKSYITHLSKICAFDPRIYVQNFISFFNIGGQLVGENDIREMLFNLIKIILNRGQLTDLEFIITEILKIHPNHQLLIELQSLLLMNSQLLPKLSIKDPVVTSFIELIGTDVVENTNYILLIQNITDSASFPYLLASFNKLDEIKADKKQMFDSLYEHVRDYPSLINILILLSLQIGDDEMNLIASALADIGLNIEKADCILDFEFWFILPILLSTHLGKNSMYSISCFLASMAERSNTKAKTIKDIFCFIHLMGLTSEPMDYMLTLFIENILPLAEQTRGILIVMIFVSTFIRLNDNTISPQLQDMFEKSPFVAEYEKVKTNFSPKYKQIRSIKELMTILKQDSAKLHMLFRIRLNEKREWIDAGRAYMLEALLNSNQYETFEFTGGPSGATPVIKSNTGKMNASDFEDDEKTLFLKLFLRFFINKKEIDISRLSIIFSKLDNYIMNSKMSYTEFLRDFTRRAFNAFNEVLTKIKEVN